MYEGGGYLGVSEGEKQDNKISTQFVRDGND